MRQFWTMKHLTCFIFRMCFTQDNFWWYTTHPSSSSHGYNNSGFKYMSEKLAFVSRLLKWCLHQFKLPKGYLVTA